MSQQIVGAVGIDFGSLRSVIAVAKKGGVDVIANEASHRETQNIVAYGDNERYMGEQAGQQAKSNFKNTVSFFNRLLGIPKDYPFLKEETKWLTSKVTPNEQGRLSHEVIYQGSKQNYLPEQVTATMLGKLRNIIEKNNINSKEAVVSVPTYYTEQERKALLDAAKIAELNITRVFNESSAIALSYGLFRKAELENNNPRNVVFVDFGHSKLSAFAAGFTKEKATILAQIHERNLGARDLDWVVFKYYADMFEKQSGLSPFESKKAQLRLLEAIEKQRKVLSANQEAAINVEYLMEDADLNHLLNREEFEKLIQPGLQRIEASLNQLKAEIDEKKINIHSVEVIGGATRIPVVQELIRKIFNKEQVQRTLNASECIARGCAMMAAMVSPLFKVAEYQLEEQNYYPIKVSWQFQKAGGANDQQMEIENQGESKSSLIFAKGCTLPNIKSLTFNKSDPIQLNLFYDPAPQGFPAEVAQLNVQASNPKEPKFSIKVRIILNKNGLVGLQDATLTEEYTVEEKIEKPKKKEEPKPATTTDQQPPADGTNPSQDQMKAEEKPAEPEFEIKKKDKTRTSNINVQSSSLYQFPQKQIDDFFQTEATLANQDRLTQETHHKKNELESFIYTWREQLTGHFNEFANPEIVPQIQQKLQESEEWLYGEGAKTTKNQYATRIDELHKLCNPIKHRYDQFQNVPLALQDLVNKVQEYENFAANTDAKFDHITFEEREKLKQECLKVRQWAQQITASSQAQKKFQDPVATVEQVTQKYNELSNNLRPIVQKPRPEPKKEEKPTQMEQENKKDTNTSQGDNKPADNSNNANPNNNTQESNPPPKKDGMDIELD